MAKKPVQTEKLPFLKGRVYDLTLFVVSLIIVLVLAVQVPFSADSYDDRVGVLLFSVYGIVGVVSVLMIRRGMILALKRPKTDPQHGNPFYRWFFFWLLIPAIFITLLPWIVSGAFNAEDVNTIGAMALVLLLPWVMILLGFSAAAIGVYPIEITIRSIGTLIRTKGKDGLGGIMIGGYLLLVLAFIICGSFAASAILPGQAGHGALVAALFGIPGGYIIKDEAFLWAARVIGIFVVILPFVFHTVTKNKKESRIAKEMNTKIR